VLRSLLDSVQPLFSIRTHTDGEFTNDFFELLVFFFDLVVFKKTYGSAGFGAKPAVDGYRADSSIFCSNRNAHSVVFDSTNYLILNFF